MPEFTPPKPPTPPEASLTVKAADFIAALKGETELQTTSLFVATGKKLKGRKEFANSYLDDNTSYLVLYEAKIEDTETLGIIQEELTDCKKGVLLYKCILPKITLQKTITKGWLLINTFTQGINISESQSGYIRIDNNSQSGEISIDNNSQSGNIIIDNNSLSGEISINDNSQSGYIGIYNNSQSGYIGIYNNSQSGYIGIYNNSQSGNIIIDNNSLSENIIIYNNSQSENIGIKTSMCGGIYLIEKSKSGDIHIENKSQCENVLVNRDSQCGDIYINDNSQSGEISLNNNSQCQDIIINKSQSGDISIRESQCTTLVMDYNYAGIELYNASIPQMRLSNCFLPSISWQAGTKGELYISNCRINHLALNHTALLKDALFSVVDSEIYIAEMNKLAVQGQLLFTNTQPLPEPFKWEPVLKKELADKKSTSEATVLKKKIYTARLALLEKQEREYNKGVESLKEKFTRYNEKSKAVENKPLWIIASSSLGKTEITGSDLKGFRFEYRDSKILDMFIAGTKLPKGEIEIYEPKQDDDIDFFEQQVSVYSQLKKIFDYQGNIVESTWYHSKTMEKQQMLLKLVYDKNKKGWFSEEGFDLFNFKLNKWSNNHGESWRRALLFVFVSSLLVYIGYYISLYYKEPFSFAATGRFVGHFFAFLNITRKEDFIPGADHTGGLSLFLSFLGRIVTGFGIYQLIAAFRRHGRK